MHKSYRSAVSVCFWLPLMLFLVALNAYFIWMQHYWLCVLYGAVLFFLIIAMVNLKYYITPSNKLYIRSGVFNNDTIDIMDIEYIKPCKRYYITPAFSFDMMQINLGYHQNIYISPANRVEFLHELKLINPQIRIYHFDDDLRISE